MLCEIGHELFLNGSEPTQHSPVCFAYKEPLICGCKRTGHMQNARTFHRTSTCKGRREATCHTSDMPPHACFGSAGANRASKCASLSPGRSKCTLWAAGQLIVHQREIVGQLCEAVTVTLVDDLLQRYCRADVSPVLSSHSRADHCARLSSNAVCLSSARTFISAQTLCLSSICSGVKHT